MSHTILVWYNQVPANKHGRKNGGFNMNSFEDTWRDRNGLTASSYGLVLIHMLTVQMVAYYQYKQLTPEKQEKVEKLIKNYQWKTSKNGAASVIEAICNLLNPNHEIAWLNDLLNGCCHRNSFYGDFGLNHVFAVIFLPINIGNVTRQKKYHVDIHGRFDEAWGERHSLFQILEIYREILKWHETKGQTEVNPIYRFGQDFVDKATIETAEDQNAVNEQLELYHDVQLKYGRA